MALHRVIIVHLKRTRVLTKLIAFRVLHLLLGLAYAVVQIFHCILKMEFATVQQELTIVLEYVIFVKQAHAQH